MLTIHNCCIDAIFENVGEGLSGPPARHCLGYQRTGSPSRECKVRPLCSANAGNTLLVSSSAISSISITMSSYVKCQELLQYSQKLLEDALAKSCARKMVNDLFI